MTGKWTEMVAGLSQSARQCGAPGCRTAARLEHRYCGDHEQQEEEEEEDTQDRPQLQLQRRSSPRVENMVRAAMTGKDTKE
jgi:hypothetical protein